MSKAPNFGSERFVDAVEPYETGIEEDHITGVRTYYFSNGDSVQEAIIDQSSIPRILSRVEDPQPDTLDTSEGIADFFVRD